MDLLTSSQFGQAIGVGYESRYELLLKAVTPQRFRSPPTAFQSQGIATEPKIMAMYQRSFGYQHTVIESTNRKPIVGGPANGMRINGTPDGEVLDPNTGKLLGFLEFKTACSGMYTAIPRMHMAQIQGMMAISGVSWCDYIVVHERTKKLMYRRVQFSPVYWLAIRGALDKFMHLKEMALERARRGVDPLKFSDVNQLKDSDSLDDKRRPFDKTPLYPGESEIVIENMLTELPPLRHRPQLTRYKFRNRPPRDFDHLFNRK